MQKNNLKRIHKNKKARQIGRGGSKAKTAGRGTKGQNARAGRKKRPELRDFIKRIPKLRGRGKNINTSVQTKPVAFKLELIEKTFLTSEVVNPTTLQQKGLLNTYKGRLPKVKIIGNTPLTKKVKFESVVFSREAKAVAVKSGAEVVVK